ncbi:FHA domain-containing protein [Cylindrospermum sp. FACHB-282]|uniref:FHA domain-containing protein n=1 Tax=Cylindrospermum sp. FACHB-282 TaxID=2692794 RepID=UPI001684F950|nr:FHA domain-containing protein [Cylindrospermum sp. FACHB-282]MBD2387321.1 FHA domain-containing protein [Cylindrospermum sp. FACHB-282]
MQIQLSWIDPNTEERLEPLLETPVAIGRQFAKMPQQSNGKKVSRLVIEDDLVADYHALIDWQDQELIIVDQNTISGIKINGVKLTKASLKNGDRISVGSCDIVISFTASRECDRMIGFLFKRRCGRTDTTDCPHCNQSYETDYAYYSDYGDYRSGYWGSDYYNQRRNIDFTEADGASLEDESDTDFERNMGAS